MFHGQVMYRHLKEQKLALFTSLEKGDFLETTWWLSRLSGHKYLEQEWTKMPLKWRAVPRQTTPGHPSPNSAPARAEQKPLVTPLVDGVTGSAHLRLKM